MSSHDCVDPSVSPWEPQCMGADEGVWMPDDDDARFAENVKLERERLGWSQGELARRLREEGGLSNFHQTTVSRVEKGERPVRLAEARAIAQVLGSRVSLLVMSNERYRPLQRFASCLHDLREAHAALGDARSELDGARAALVYAMGELTSILEEGESFWADSLDAETTRAAVEEKLDRARSLVLMDARDVLDRIEDEEASAGDYFAEMQDDIERGK